MIPIFTVHSSADLNGKNDQKMTQHNRFSLHCVSRLGDRLDQIPMNMDAQFIIEMQGRFDEKK